VQIIAQAMAALPCHVTTRDGGEKQYDHAAARLLGAEPNEYMTAAVFRETLFANALLWGFGAAFIEKDERGVPTALYPCVRPSPADPHARGELVYQTSSATPRTTSNPTASSTCRPLARRHHRLNPIAHARRRSACRSPWTGTPPSSSATGATSAAF
jgi:phage portal protein BeeE